MLGKVCMHGLRLLCWPLRRPLQGGAAPILADAGTATAAAFAGSSRLGTAARCAAAVDSVIADVLQDLQCPPDALRALLAALPAPGDVITHKPLPVDAFANTSTSSAGHTTEHAVCRDDESSATSVDGAVAKVTVGAVLAAAMQAGDVPSSTTVDDIIALLFAVSPALLRLSPSAVQLSGLVCRLRHQAGRPGTDDDDKNNFCAQCVTAGESQQVLRHVLVSWQPWVDDNVYERLCRSITHANRSDKADALVRYLYAMHALHRRAVPMRTATMQYVEWLLHHVPPYYIPLALVTQGTMLAATDTQRAPPAQAGRALNWVDVVRDAREDKLLIAWSADGTLLRLRAPPQSTHDNGVPLPREWGRSVRAWAIRSAHYTAPQRYALLPHNPELFHAALRLLVHVVPTFWVSLASVRDVYGTVVSNETALSSADNTSLPANLPRALRDRFPAVECLLGHPDLASALVWDAATAGVSCRVRLHPHLAHTDRGVADKLYDDATTTVACDAVTTPAAARDVAATSAEAVGRCPAVAVPAAPPEAPSSASTAALDDYLTALQTPEHAALAESRESSVVQETVAGASNPSVCVAHTMAGAGDSAVTEREELLRALTQEAAALYQTTLSVQTSEAVRPAVLFDAPAPAAPTLHRTRGRPGGRVPVGMAHAAGVAELRRRQGGGGEEGGLTSAVAPSAPHSSWPLPSSSPSNAPVTSAATPPHAALGPCMPTAGQATDPAGARDALRALFDP